MTRRRAAARTPTTIAEYAAGDSRDDDDDDDVGPYPTYDSDEENIGNVFDFDDTKKKTRGRCHGKMCGPCPLLFCVQCLGCLLLVAGIVVVIVLCATGSTFDRTISEIQEALGLTDEERRRRRHCGRSLRRRLSTGAPAIADTPTASPTPVPTLMPTAGPTKRIYAVPNCTEKKALYYLDFHARGGGNGDVEGAVATTINGTFAIRGEGQKAPLVYKAQVLNGKFESAQGPWMCLDKCRCHKVEINLVDVTMKGQTEMGWALRRATVIQESPATTDEAAGGSSGEGAAPRAEPNTDQRPVASGLIPLAGETGGDGSCGFATPPLSRPRPLNSARRPAARASTLTPKSTVRSPEAIKAKTETRTHEDGSSPRTAGARRADRSCTSRSSREGRTFPTLPHGAWS